MAEKISRKKIINKISPAMTILLTFLVIIFVGTVLLILPIATISRTSIGFLDALFMATSATCLTGLAVVELFATFSAFGKVVILLLVQIGALGFMTILTIGLLMLKKKVSLRDRMIIQASYNQDKLSGMVKLVKSVVIYTFIIEAIGMLFLTVGFLLEGFSFLKSLGFGVFHAITAFCNAGFDILGSNSLVDFRSNALIVVPIILLIIFGGLGFPVLMELKSLFTKNKQYSFGRRVKKLSLHTKIVLTTTAVLLVLGFLLFLLLEWNSTLSELSVGGKLAQAFFQSVTLRTAGFSTIDQSNLTDVSKVYSCIFMFFGGSPASTAGGIKTTSLAVIVITMFSVFRGKEKSQAFGKRLPFDILQKALAISCSMLTLIFLSATILVFTESSLNQSFLNLLFLSTSAVTTTGVSASILGGLSVVGKLLITICMFIGRLGPLTIVVALSVKLHKAENSIGLLEERVILG